MSTKWRMSGALAAAVLGFAACGSSEPEAVVDVVPAADQPAGQNGDGNAAVSGVGGGVASCAGRYTGRFEGGESGVLAVAVGGNGSVVTSAYPGLDVDYSDDGFIRIDGATGSVEVGPDGIIVAGDEFVNVGSDGVVIGGDGRILFGEGELVVEGDDGTVVLGDDGGMTVEGDDGTVVVGEDGGITVDGPDGTIVVGGDGGITIDPDGPPRPRRQGVAVGPGGIAIGAEGGVAVTTGTGQVGDDGLVSIVTDSGRVLSGAFDWTSCTGSGTWTVSGVNGTWQVAQDTTQLHVPDRACDGTVFVGNGTDDVLVGPGGVAVGTGGVSVGSGAIEVTPDGVSIGSGVVDLDAVCASQAVAAAQPVAFDEVDDSVTIQEGDGFTSYGIDGDVLFAFNSSDVDAAAQATLDGIIGSMSERYPGAPIQILGHTDSVGSEQSNIELSQARAQSVAVIVGGDTRLAGTAIETFGLGESSPVAANANPDGTDNAAGRALNRRVEIVVQTG